MSVVKFECPACGQHMECERACSGDVIHCPRCCAQIRIPFHSAAELDGSASRAELVAPAGGAGAAKQDGLPGQRPEPQPQEVSAAISCPACHAALKVSIPY